MPPLIDWRGRVEERPVPRLLVLSRGEQLTGRIDLYELAGPSSTIYLRRGLPVHVVRPDSLDRLDLVLVEAGVVSGVDIARAQAVRESKGILMGQALLELGLVAEGQLAEALQWQLKRKLTRLFAPQDATYAVTSADHPFGVNGTSPGAAIDTRALIFSGILSRYSETKLIAELGQLAGKLVRLRPVSSGELNGLGFDHRHAPLLTHLRLAGFRLDEAWIQGTTGPRPREAKSILLALLYLDLLDYAGEPVKQTLARVPTVPVIVPARVLPAKPRETTPLPALDPDHLYALGRQLFGKGDLARAEAAFQGVADAAPQHRRARAFLTWIQFWKKPEGERREAIEPTLKSLRELLKSEEEFAAGHYFMGVLSKLRQDLGRAEQAFRTALRHDPEMIEAQRELRLMTMRKLHR